MPEVTWQALVTAAIWTWVVYRIGLSVGARRASQGLSGPPAAASPPFDMSGLPPDTRAAIDDALARREKIEAIRILREASGMGLKESKEAIEGWERNRP